MPFIKSKDYIQENGITKGRLSQLINGSHRKVTNKSGEPKTYILPPKFRKNIDYKWIDGKLFIKKNAKFRKKNLTC